MQKQTTAVPRRFLYRLLLPRSNTPVQRASGRQRSEPAHELSHLRLCQQMSAAATCASHALAIAKFYDAIRTGSAAQVRSALREGQNVNVVFDFGADRGSTPLLVAASKGHREVCDALLAAKANINASDGFGLTALSVASHGGHSEVCTALLAAGAQINMATRDGSYTPYLQRKPAIGRCAKPSLQQGPRPMQQLDIPSHPLSWQPKPAIRRCAQNS